VSKNKEKKEEIEQKKTREFKKRGTFATPTRNSKNS
jgi:hypothetical protein